jgi:hypothetical protein
MPNQSFDEALVISAGLIAPGRIATLGPAVSRAEQQLPKERTPCKALGTEPKLPSAASRIRPGNAEHRGSWLREAGPGSPGVVIGTDTASRTLVDVGGVKFTYGIEGLQRVPGPSAKADIANRRPQSMLL